MQVTEKNRAQIDILEDFSLLELSEIIKDPSMDNKIIHEVQERKRHLWNNILTSIPDSILSEYLNTDRKLSLLSERLTKYMLNNPIVQTEITNNINRMKELNVQYPLLCEYFFNGDDADTALDLFNWHYM